MIIDNFSKYQIDWLTSHNDIAFNKEEEDLIVRFLKDTAEMYQRENECEDCISREELRKLICQNNDRYGYSDRFHEFTEQCLQLPSVTPKYTDEEIQKMQELEQAQLKKAYELGMQTSFEEWISSFNTESAPQCFNAVQQLKEKIDDKS